MGHKGGRRQGFRALAKRLIQPQQNLGPETAWQSGTGNLLYIADQTQAQTLQPLQHVRGQAQGGQRQGGKGALLLPCRHDPPRPEPRHAIGRAACARDRHPRRQPRARQPRRQVGQHPSLAPHQMRRPCQVQHQPIRPLCPDPRRIAQSPALQRGQSLGIRLRIIPARDQIGTQRTGIGQSHSNAQTGLRCGGIDTYQSVCPCLPRDQRKGPRHWPAAQGNVAGKAREPDRKQAAGRGHGSICSHYVPFLGRARPRVESTPFQIANRASFGHNRPKLCGSGR